MNQVPAHQPRLARASLRFEYRLQAMGNEPPPDALLQVGFGGGTHTAERRVDVGLKPLVGAGMCEIWRAQGPVQVGESVGIRFSHDGRFLAGALQIVESAHDGLAAATAQAYGRIAAFQSASEYPHLLRTWNYFDAINEGPGEAERYRGFCAGRVAGLAGLRQIHHPAATVIGRRDGDRILQVYWLAGREPGLALENPRQVSAYEYPRQYGSTAPTFSRAMLVSPQLLMISGTASIVGHASRHLDDTLAQVREIFANLDSLLARARAEAPSLPARLGPQTLVKAYVRKPEHAPLIEAALRERLPADMPLLLLQGDVCRAELLVEMDCLAQAGG